ncbi:pyridoxal phosphate-dependent aminotransferase [Desulfobacter curvatus]|uniref:pyridoxal phosphate-dependent aminotransferase n=1 Tax=Desulfobacter curvatus TaxID=2290 RepID=UPI00037D51F7|nr:histidinol-phosphate transaminase [Desulfobacter curvatus]
MTRPSSKALYTHLRTQHGGYHRYGLTDHAYLYNLYFPPEALIDHLKAETLNLVRNYPVAQKDLAGLVQKISYIPRENLVVGNGAAELIKIISTQVARRLIIPVPSFNEYINAAPGAGAIEFMLHPPEFELDPERFVSQAVSSGADTAVIVSPNNPTSLGVSPEKIHWMAERFQNKEICFIVDESFIDFCDTASARSMETHLSRYPNLAVIKSMSKAYGICGLRLGYLATENERLLSILKAGVHIWNINGFAEEFLRLLPRFEDAFKTSCRRVINDRDDFYRGLSQIRDLKVFRPDANFIFCRLPDWAPPAADIAEQLFVRHQILVKECSGKTMAEGDRYLRIASRRPMENKVFTEAFFSLLESLGGGA